MDKGNSEIDSLAPCLDSWKDLVPKLKLLLNEKNANLVSNLALVSKIILDTSIRLGVVCLVLQQA